MGMFDKNKKNKTNATSEPQVAEKREPKLITFVGAERGDFAYHTARLLSSAYNEESILVIDNSTNLDLFKSIKSADGEVAMSGNITFVHDRKYSELAFFHFAFIIAYLGYQYDNEYAYYADNVVLCSDYSALSVEKIAGFSEMMNGAIPENEDVLIPLFYNKSSSKLREKVLLENMGITSYQPPISVELALENHSGYLNLQYNGKQQLAHMGSEYIESIVLITAALTEMSERTLQKIAKKG